MSKITFTKQNGQPISGPEITEIINSTNALYDLLFANGVPVSGKVLSSNDFTTALKEKLESITPGSGSLPSDFFVGDKMNTKYLEDVDLSPDEFFERPDGDYGILSVTSNTTTKLTEAQLNSAYGTKLSGFIVKAPFIAGGGLEYIKFITNGTTTWRSKAYATVDAGSSLPAQPAMTAAMINDNDTTNKRTISNYPAGKTFADAETSVDGAVTFLAHTSNDFDIGNVALAPGQIVTRFKANANFSAGTGYANTVAYTVTAETNYTNVSVWPGLSGTSLSGNKLSATNGSSRSYSNLRVVGGNVASFKCTPIAAGGGFLFGPNKDNFYNFNEALFLFSQNPENNRQQAYGANDVPNVETDNGLILAGAVTFVDFTATQILWFYQNPGGAKTQYAAADIVVGKSYWMTVFMGNEDGVVDNIQQRGAVS